MHARLRPVVVAGLVGVVMTCLVGAIPQVDSWRWFVSGGLLAVMYLSSTAMVAAVFFESRELSSAVILVYVTKVSIVAATVLLFASQFSYKDATSIGSGVLCGSAAYLMAMLAWVVLRNKQRFLVAARRNRLRI